MERIKIPRFQTRRNFPSFKGKTLKGKNKATSSDLYCVPFQREDKFQNFWTTLFPLDNVLDVLLSSLSHILYTSISKLLPFAYKKYSLVLRIFFLLTNKTLFSLYKYLYKYICVILMLFPFL